MITHSITVLAILAYLVSAGLILRGLRQHQKAAPPVALWLWSVAILAHALVLGQTLVRPDGLDLCLYNALSMVAWLVSLLLWISSLRMPVHALAVPLLPTTALVLALLALLHPSIGKHIIIAPPGLQLHVVGSLLAYSLLSLATLQALVLAYQDHQLRGHRVTGWMSLLPPLQPMEHFLFQLIGAGFLLLSLALVSGFMFLENIFAQHLVHKTVLSIAAWFIFGALLLGRWRLGWRGRTAIRWTLVGFSLLMLAYFGSKLVIEIILAPTT
ncbi:MAG: inner membrane protein YpjD [Thiotrichales bacterium]